MAPGVSRFAILRVQFLSHGFHWTADLLIMICPGTRDDDRVNQQSKACFIVMSSQGRRRWRGRSMDQRSSPESWLDLVVVARRLVDLVYHPSEAL